MSGTYTARARRWAGGWELHIDGVGVTQVATLARAEQQVRDYLATLYDIDASQTEVDIIPELGGVEERALAARRRQKRIDQERREAARDMEQAVRDLRSAGLSVSETAAVLKVTRGRVSQLSAPRDIENARTEVSA